MKHYCAKPSAQLPKHMHSQGSIYSKFGGGGGGGAIVNNVYSYRGWVREGDVLPPAQSTKTETFHDLTEL